MKRLSLLTSLLLGFVTASLQAGESVAYKQVAPPPPPPLYGIGFYGAIDMGANVYQNRGDTRTFTADNPNSPFFGDTLTVVQRLRATSFTMAFGVALTSPCGIPLVPF